MRGWLGVDISALAKSIGHSQRTLGGAPFFTKSYPGFPVYPPRSPILVDGERLFLLPSLAVFSRSDWVYVEILRNLWQSYNSATSPTSDFMLHSLALAIDTIAYRCNKIIMRLKKEKVKFLQNHRKFGELMN